MRLFVLAFSRQRRGKKPPPRWLQLPEPADGATIPADLYTAAKESIERDYLIRYFTKKYQMPPTDPRLLAYTREDMLIEFVADAIEEDRIPLGVDGQPVRKVKHKGETMTLTGSRVFDALEREWADQDVAAIKREANAAQDDVLPDETDILAALLGSQAQGDMTDGE